MVRHDVCKVYTEFQLKVFCRTRTISKNSWVTSNFCFLAFRWLEISVNILFFYAFQIYFSVSPFPGCFSCEDLLLSSWKFVVLGRPWFYYLIFLYRSYACSQLLSLWEKQRWSLFISLEEHVQYFLHSFQ